MLKLLGLAMLICVGGSGCFEKMLLGGTVQVGGGVCTNSTVAGTYFYLLSGTTASGSSVYPYAELGKLASDGNGNVSGSSNTNVGGALASHSLIGTYSVQANCSGSMNVTIDSATTETITFQLVGGGQGMVVAFSLPSAVVAGRAYRQTVSGTSGPCSTGSLSGSYGYLLTGVAFVSGGALYYTDAGSVSSDGNGNISATSVANLSGTSGTITGQGPYTVAADCSGTAQITNQNGTANYLIALVEDGQAILFIGNDTTSTISGSGQPEFIAPQAAVVNGASYDYRALSPGGLFSIFGTNLGLSPGGIQVIVNGETAPLLFANSNQLNAQMPVDAPTDRPVSLVVTNSGAVSNTVTVTVHPAGPGFFTYGQNRAIVQNQDGTLNSPTAPAHAGDIVTAYLTGGGSVNPAIPTGQAAPDSPLSRVTGGYSFAIGGQSVEVSYFGLTPGFIGLYQANLKVPATASSGDYPLTAMSAGLNSNGPVIAVVP